MEKCRSTSSKVRLAKARSWSVRDSHVCLTRRSWRASRGEMGYSCSGVSLMRGLRRAVAGPSAPEGGPTRPRGRGRRPGALTGRVGGFGVTEGVRTPIPKAPRVAFIQTGGYCGAYFSESCCLAAQELDATGYVVKTFDRANLPPAHEVTPRTPVKGSTRSVRLIFERMFPGVRYPNIDVPPELAKYARRTITPTTLGAARELMRGARPGTKFIKPACKAKLFRGVDLSIASHYTSRFPDFTPVLLQDYREFGHEERYVITPKQKALYSAGLPGSGRNHKEFAEKLARVWGRAAPACYVLDVAMSYRSQELRELETLVEVNSLLTAGNLYGVSKARPGLLSRLLAEAWESYACYGETGSFRKP